MLSPPPLEVVEVVWGDVFFPREWMTSFFHLFCSVISLFRPDTFSWLPRLFPGWSAKAVFLGHFSIVCALYASYQSKSCDRSVAANDPLGVSRRRTRPGAWKKSSPWCAIVLLPRLPHCRLAVLIAGTKFLLKEPFWGPVPLGTFATVPQALTPKG